MTHLRFSVNTPVRRPYLALVTTSSTTTDPNSGLLDLIVSNVDIESVMIVAIELDICGKEL
jgi:hypothetical protein